MLLIACDGYAAALYASSTVLSEFGKKRFRIIGVFLWRFHSCQRAFQVVVNRVMQFGSCTYSFFFPETATLRIQVTVLDC